MATIKTNVVTGRRCVEHLYFEGGEEYKKFGHGGGAPKGPPPTVIQDFDSQSDAKSAE